jgi:hypothetical protein
MSEVKTFSDGCNRVLLSSVSNYYPSTVNSYGSSNYDVGITFRLKSGQKVEMSFGKSYLRDRAMQWLDTYFGKHEPVWEPCEDCKHQHKTSKEEPCMWCYPARAYNKFERRKEVPDATQAVS